jgi:hypothetical protein
MFLLLQLCQEGDKDLSVCVIEKGSEVGECLQSSCSQHQRQQQSKLQHFQ